MNKLLLTIPFLSAGLLAQTYVICGDVSLVQGTSQYRLAATNIPLVSTSVDLKAMYNASLQQPIEYEMKVVDVGIGGVTVLDVQSAGTVPEQFDMGELRLGQIDEWTLLGPPGSFYQVWVTVRDATSFLPLAAFDNAWFMGPLAVPAFQGPMPTGIGQFKFQMPMVPELVGVEFSAQSLLLAKNNVLTITHPVSGIVQKN